MKPRIAVFHGGPGLSAAYFHSLARGFASRATFEFHNPLGCDPQIRHTHAPSLEDTISDFATWFNTLRSSGVRLILAHSWGAFVLFSLLGDELDLADDCRISLWNPVPLDRETYDAAVSRLVSRVTPEAAAAMGALGSDPAAGKRMMDIAWSFYSPGAEKPADLSFDYFPEIFSSVSSGLGSFDYWVRLEKHRSSTEIVLGSNDYIYPDDFLRVGTFGIRTRVVQGGHFPFVEDVRVFEESLSWLLG